MAKRKRLTPGEFAQAGWDDVLPHYDWLAEAPLSKRTVKRWLNEWAALEAAVGEAIALASIAFSANTTDPELEAAYLRFTGEIQPRCAEQFVRLGTRLLDLGYEDSDLQPTLRNLRNQQALVQPDNLPLQEALQESDAEYQRIIGGMTVLWNDEQIPIMHLAPEFQSATRPARKRAYRAFFGAVADERDSLADLFDRQLALRQQIAHNAGFANYRDYAFREKNRFDYGPAECFDFQGAVARVVVPVMRRRMERHRHQARTHSVRPWDARADPLRRPGLQPFQSVDELVERTGEICRAIDPVFGERFALMRAEGLLDLEPRPGKAPVGFCTSLLFSERPLIFLNATGIPQDVTTLFHETGHALHLFEIFDHQPPYLRDWPCAEMTELGAMTMELLADPFLERDRGGFYSAADARRARAEHLQFVLELLIWVATIDAFQHWLYTDPAAANRDRRDTEWLRLSEHFNPGIDWSGLKRERVAQWHQQPHLFTVPFYFIEYAIAQIGALYIWQRSLSDREGTLHDFRAALALGNTRTLPELFAVAGAPFRFDAEALTEVVRLIECELTALDS